MKNAQGGIVRARRVDVMLALLFGLLIVSGAALAQGDPTSNVNLIGMTPDPDDIPDIGYRQQNEPACAIRPGDSACIICAYNDYRGVDFPVGNPIGDSWQGVSQSCDAGNTWRSRLAPGFPGDLDAENIPAEFAADPRLVAIPGMAIFNFIAGYRDSNVGVLAIQHWLEVNKEDADHYEPSRVTWFADTGTSGRFLDKPDIIGVLDPTGPQSTIELVTEMENTELGDNGVITRSFPTGKLYVAYAVFTGSNSIKVLVKTSDDWGRTFKNQSLKLSEDQNEVSGVSLTPVGDKVVAVWRRKGDNNDLDSIMYAVIRNGGKKATKAKVLADICPFDQPTLAGETFDVGNGTPEGPFVAFRTNDFPWAATDGNNVFVFFSEKKRNADGSCDVFSRPRIVMNYSTDAGQSWLGQPGTQAPIILDEPNDPPAPGSFQFMPTAFGANGKVQVAWYDTRRELFGGAGTLWPFVTDYDIGGSLFVQRAVDVFTTSVSLDNGVLDIPPPVRVSQYSAQLAEDTSTGELFSFDTEASLANKKLFGKGTASFLGDYIAMAARGFRKSANGKWESNASEGPEGQRREDFFAAWADNRDVVGEVTGLTDPSPYGFEADPGVGSIDDQEAMTEMLAEIQDAPRTGPPRDTSKTAEGLAGDDDIVACTPETERTRDANIYGSRIKDRERLFASTPSKPLSGLKRAFPVSLTNATNNDLEYTLRIVPATDASFRQQSQLDTETLMVRARSTEARTVFVDPIAISSVAVEAVLNGDVVSTIELGNTADFSDPENCVNGVRPDDGTPCDVAENELHDLELQQLSPEAAALLNAALLNAALLNVGVTASELDPSNVNAALLNAALLNADLLNANLLNPTLVALAEEGGSADPTCGSTDPVDILYPSLCPDFVGDSDPTDIINYAVANPDTINAALLNAALLNAALLNANLLNANLLNANLLNANLLNANLLNANLLNANLLNANLLNANLLNANLLNADLVNANLLNANLLNANLLNATIAEDPTATITYDDYTYPVTNNGNVTTSVNADIQINAPAALDEHGIPIDVDADGNPIKDVLGTKLMAWTANATPTRVNCEDRVQLDSRVQSIAPNPDNDLKIAEITSPFDGEVTAIAAPGETVFFTLRVVGTPEQLRNVRVSGFTASSQASNCRVDATEPDGYFCEDNLRDDNERILFQDTIPPVLTINGDNPTIVEAGIETYTELGATATDNIDGDISTDVLATPFPGPVDSSAVADFWVEYTVSDSAGNPATPVTRTVNVVDTTPPGALAGLPTPPAALDATSSAGAVYSWGPVTADDAVDGTITAVCLSSTGLTSGSTFPIGSTPVICTATDGAGLSSTGSFTVTVEDLSPPGALAGLPTPPAALDATSSAGAVYSWGPVTADDAVDGTITAVCLSSTGLTSGSTFPIGATGTEVICTATDGAGLSSTGSFTVIVADLSPPVLPPLPDLEFQATSTGGTPVSWSEVAVDLVDGPVPVACSPASGSTFAIGGPTQVSCSSSDQAGNLSSATFNVTIVDTTAPVIDDVTPPDGFDPDSPFPFELEADQSTLTLTWPINVNDADPLLDIRCYVNWDPATETGDEIQRVSDPQPIIVAGNERISASFLYPFPVGDTDIVCAATDTNGLVTIPFTITVLDKVDPVVTVSVETLEIESETSPTVVNYFGPTPDQDLVTVTVEEFGYPGTEAVCEPSSGSEFTWGSTTVTCTATDGSGNTGTDTFVVNVRYLYDVNLILPKGRARAGSTIPIDWQYIDRDTMTPIDSSAFMVGVEWEKTDDATSSSQACADLTPVSTDGSSFLIDADSGNSDFRYSNSSDTWQFSWQTPDALGWHRLSVYPPGGDIPEATACVRLR